MSPPVRFLMRYVSEGVQYRCVIRRDGKTRKSRWFDTRPAAFSDALFWHKFYGRRAE